MLAEMLHLLMRRNPCKQMTRDVYANVLVCVRQPKFYEKYGVPDTFDGRFDLMVLFIFLVFQRMLEEGRDEALHFNQALFDVCFEDMDQTLREMGIGDMGVPKHMRKMMKAFNGRMHAYEQALTDGDLAAALRKNLYGSALEADEKKIAKMEVKALEILAFLKIQDMDAILSGKIAFEKE